MVTKNFILDLNRFKRRTKTELQHKLRVVMNCYTISEFKLNETDNTFSFKKNYKINGLRINDNKILTGNYTFEELLEEKCRITITVNT